MSKLALYSEKERTIEDVKKSQRVRLLVDGPFALYAMYLGLGGKLPSTGRLILGLFAVGSIIYNLNQYNQNIKLK